VWRYNVGKFSGVGQGTGGDIMWGRVAEWDRPRMAIIWRRGLHAIYMPGR